VNDKVLPPRFSKPLCSRINNIRFGNAGIGFNGLAGAFIQSVDQLFHINSKVRKDQQNLEMLEMKVYLKISLIVISNLGGRIVN